MSDGWVKGSFLVKRHPDTWALVPGWHKGIFGIAKHGRSDYGVTHLPTGYLVMFPSFRLLSEAKTACGLLEARGNWRGVRLSQSRQLALSKAANAVVTSMGLTPALLVRIT